MSISTELSRIQAARNKLRTKAVALGLSDSSATLDVLANAVEGIADRGTVNANVKEGEAYTVQPGYYHGGTVNGVSGGGSYTLQEKAITPAKASQVVTSDDGYYGLSQVTVEAIPAAYQDVSSVTVAAPDMLVGKVAVNAAGTTLAGSMPNVGKAAGEIDGLTSSSYTIAKGYHDGTGKVTLTADIENALAAI